MKTRKNEITLSARLARNMYTQARTHRRETRALGYTQSLTDDDDELLRTYSLLKRKYHVISDDKELKCNESGNYQGSYG
uniref:Uncharacterized protein n=1 Tax=Trichogramma kaykai TaxID=54128 RepID=A0ABD2VT50_9HYME